MSQTILVADDDNNVQISLNLLLTTEGFSVQSASNPQEISEQLKTHSIDLVLLDMNYETGTTSGMEGLNLISEIQKQNTDLPIIVMTGWGTVTVAVEAMRRGAKDFIEKPWRNERLLSIIRTQLKMVETVKQNQSLQHQNQTLKAKVAAIHQQSIDLIGTQSEAMKTVLEQINSVCQTDVSVLLIGENGTGKSLIAQYLHQTSLRKNHSFIAANLGAIPNNLFESELFGHVKGAFTGAEKDRLGRFQLAEKGSLFLDEIGNLELEQQAKLLRVLEEHIYEPVGSSNSLRADVRIISATNALLQEKVQANEFRQDLFFRINTVTIRMPSLKERADDIPELAKFFLNQFSQKYHKSIVGFSPKAMDILLHYDWPGNIRELTHCLERACLFAKSETIQPLDLGLGVESSKASAIDLTTMTLDDAEKYLIEQALKRFHGNASQAQKALGLSRSAFYRRLEKHGI